MSDEPRTSRRAAGEGAAARTRRRRRNRRAVSGGGRQRAGAGPAVLDAALSRRQAAARARRTPVLATLPAARAAVAGYSGPGPDPRDPQPLSAVLNRLVKARGWQQPAAEATVFGAWERVVGAEVAQNSRPVKLENGELTVEARSTAWATQLRLLAGSLLKQIASEVGHNVVRKLHIHGPAAPSWGRAAPVRGRGPRDTYG
ncbi:DciA family protein [Micromonospora sp. M12]